MNNDGWGQVGAGQDDMRQAGRDLQHSTQLGGPQNSSRQQALDVESARHKIAKLTRLKHLEDHYNR